MLDGAGRFDLDDPDDLLVDRTDVSMAELAALEEDTVSSPRAPRAPGRPPMTASEPGRSGIGSPPKTPTAMFAEDEDAIEGQMPGQVARSTGWTMSRSTSDRTVSTANSGTPWAWRVTLERAAVQGFATAPTTIKEALALDKEGRRIAAGLLGRRETV